MHAEYSLFSFSPVVFSRGECETICFAFVFDLHFAYDVSLGVSTCCLLVDLHARHPPFHGALHSRFHPGFRSYNTRIFLRFSYYNFQNILHVFLIFACIFGTYMSIFIFVFI